MEKTFFFCAKHTSDMEPIGKCLTNSIEDAAVIFADNKQLSIDDFLTIYEVKEYANSTKSTSRDTKSS